MYVYLYIDNNTQKPHIKMYVYIYKCKYMCICIYIIIPDTLYHSSHKYAD